MQIVHTALPLYVNHRPIVVPVLAQPSAAFDNRGGSREIEANDLNNSGDYGRLNIGTSAVDNSLGGTHRTSVNGLDNSGYGAVTNIVSRTWPATSITEVARDTS